MKVMRITPVILATLLSRLVDAQVTDAAQRAPSPTVSGIVYDSVAHSVLAGATVQLVSILRQESGVRTVT